MNYRAFLFSTVLVASTFCGQLATADTAFQDFGEKAGLTQVVNDLMLNIQTDARIEHYFAAVNKDKLKASLVDQFCEILEGPCKYTGRSMKKVHDGLDIKAADFNALVEDLQKAMTKNNIPRLAQGKLLSKLAPMHRDTVTK